MQLHAQLEKDCHLLGSLAAGWLLLHRNASLPWFILVPSTEATAIYQLEDEQRIAVEQQWNDLAAWVHERFECKRVNVAAIGNLVPQLHLHIIGRTEDDPCWPGVAWGQDLPEAAWSEDQLANLRDELSAVFRLSTIDGR